MTSDCQLRRPFGAKRAWFWSSSICEYRNWQEIWDYLAPSPLLGCLLPTSFLSHDRLSHFHSPLGNDSEWIFNSLLMACYTKLEQPPTIQQPLFPQVPCFKNTISLICRLPFPIATKFGKALSKQWPAFLGD